MTNYYGNREEKQVPIILFFGIRIGIIIIIIIIIIILIIIMLILAFFSFLVTETSIYRY